MVVGKGTVEYVTGTGCRGIGIEALEGLSAESVGDGGKRTSCASNFTMSSGSGVRAESVDKLGSGGRSTLSLSFSSDSGVGDLGFAFLVLFLAG